MEQHYQTTSSVDYSLKEGETLVLQIKNVSLPCVSCSDILLSVDSKPMASDLTDVKMIQCWCRFVLLVRRQKLHLTPCILCIIRRPLLDLIRYNTRSCIMKELSTWKLRNIIQNLFISFRNVGQNIPPVQESSLIMYNGNSKASVIHWLDIPWYSHVKSMWKEKSLF